MCSAMMMETIKDVDIVRSIESHLKLLNVLNVLTIWSSISKQACVSSMNVRMKSTELTSFLAMNQHSLVLLDTASYSRQLFAMEIVSSTMVLSMWDASNVLMKLILQTGSSAQPVALILMDQSMNAILAPLDGLKKQMEEDVNELFMETVQLLLMIILNVRSVIMDIHGLVQHVSLAR